MEKWNNRYVSSPPMYYYNKQDHDVKTVTISRMAFYVSDLEDQLSNQSILADENFYLIRVLYKLKSQQRHEKAFAYLQLIKKCVQRYLDVDFCLLLNALSTDIRKPLLDAYLPSQQTFQYHMVKLMGGAGLLAQIMLYCNLVLVPIRQQMNQCHFLDKNLLFLGLAGRIWAISKVLLGFIQNGYNQMFQLLHKFPANELPWLNEDDNLPSDLGEWLASNWPSIHDTPPRFDKSEIDAKCNSPTAKKDEAELTPLINSSSSCPLFSPDEDVGVPIEYNRPTLIDVKGQKITKNMVSLKYGNTRYLVKSCKTTAEYVNNMELVQMALKLWPKTIIPIEMHEVLQQLVLQARDLDADHKTKPLRNVIKTTLATIRSLKKIHKSKFKLSPKKTKFVFQLLHRCLQKNPKLDKSLKSLEHENALHLGPVLVTLTQKKVDQIVSRLKKIAHLSKKKQSQRLREEIILAVDNHSTDKLDNHAEQQLHNVESDTDMTYLEDSAIIPSSLILTDCDSLEMQGLDESKNVFSGEKCTANVFANEKCIITDEENNTVQLPSQNSNVKNSTILLKKQRKKRRRENEAILKTKKSHDAENNKQILKVSMKKQTIPGGSKSNQKLKKWLQRK